MLTRLAALCLAFVTAAAVSAQTHQPVLLISIDGLRPDYVTHADQHHLLIPTLRRMLADGAYADGVQGVFPTVTYPSHTTLVTGVWPAEHGIVNNARFDPEYNLSGAWYWYADQIKVPTLWSAARAAGLHTASVSWPATADSSSIDTLIPEYWRSRSPGDAVNPDDRFLMNALSRPDGEAARIAQRTGLPYMMGNDTTIEGDETRTVYSLDILKQHRPEFMTIHLSSLDEEEHLYAPFSEEADKDLESLDGMVGRLAAQELRNYPNGVIAIVSDHGFAPVHSSTNFYIPFLEAGLMKIGVSAGGAVVVKSWKAQPWLGGGMAAIILHDPGDTQTRDEVRRLLEKLAANPANGIQAVLDREEVAARGGFPDAAFVVTLRPGYNTGAELTGPLVSDTAQKGTHGYDPVTTPEMRASFFIVGKGVAHGKDLGVIDMRRIAPTLAGILGVALPTARQKPLAIH